MTRKKTRPPRNDALSSALDGIDYHVECDDFLLYELGRLIEEDHASLDDAEFRRLIDEGIHEHVETRLETRAAMAMRIRIMRSKMDARARQTAAHILRAIEDIEIPLRDVAFVIRSYIAYLFRRLEDCTNKNADHENEARMWIERWQRHEVRCEEMAEQLKMMGKSALAPLADFLFDSLGDRTATACALDILSAIPSPVSARILAHAISDPMLDEDLETKAYAFVRAMWPLPRHYILYSLRPHTHEDIPFRWFQLLIESNDPEAVDRILEETLVHGGNPDFREDLLALMDLLGQSRDPGAEDKIMDVLNRPETPREVAGLLESFLKTSRQEKMESEPELRTGLRSANKKYLVAAKLFDAGRKAEALQKLNELLEEHPQYPMALMLKSFSSSVHQKSLQDLK